MEHGQSKKKTCGDCQRENVNDARYLTVKVPLWHFNVKDVSRTQSHNCDTGIPSLFFPASSEYTCDSALLWRSGGLFLTHSRNLDERLWSEYPRRSQIVFELSFRRPE